MGGFGSTCWNCVSTKDTVEANRSLDINKLNPTSRIGAILCGPPAGNQRVSRKGLHYGKGWLAGSVAVILGSG